MENSKSIFAIAPIVALIVAVAYLQGYWGYYDLLIFPYLSFNEMVAYAAAPLFGFLFAFFVGMLFGTINAFNAFSKDRKVSSKLRDWLDLLAFAAISALLLYFNRPEKWVFVPLGLTFLLTLHVLENEFLRVQIKESPKQFVIILITTYLLCGSFGFGRMKAQALAQGKEPNIQATVDGTPIRTRLIGKIDSFYFFLGMDGKVSQHPESAIKLIVYEKSF
ncbi:MAG: hypothetical protein Q7U91_13255 [Sideroxyarcus sp.]|nr:hypothetical protein [Sideroxyarcus sp.]